METTAIALKNSDGEQFAIVDCKNRTTAQILEATNFAISEEYGCDTKSISFGSWTKLGNEGSTVLKFVLDDGCNMRETIDVERTWIY